MFSCQPLESLDDVVFDNNLLTKININAEKKIVNNLYEINYFEPYIGHTLIITPLDRINQWLEDNINFFGSQNKLIINIIDASLTRIETEVKNKSNFNATTEFLYEIHFMIEFILYDDSDLVLATTEAEVNRTTTSNKFISLDQKEQIINTLILDALIDISLKTGELLRVHMSGFIL